MIGHGHNVTKEGTVLFTHNPYQKYQQSKTETVSPAELTLMLYNGCLKFMKKARQGIEAGDIEQKHNNIIKAQNIIHEFMMTLNMEIEVSKNMMQMYEYCMHRLIEANTNNDCQPLDEVEGIVTDFRDTWKLAMQEYRKQEYGEGHISEEAKIKFAQ